MEKRRIRIGQIGIGHNHAADKMQALRNLSDFFEVAGVVESDSAWREKRGDFEVYKGLKWMTAEELLATRGLEAVAVETDGFDRFRRLYAVQEHGLQHPHGQTRR